MERYLDGLESVIQSTLQMEQTRLIVKDFLYGNNDNNDDDHSEGKRLQKLLIEYAKQTDNWVSVKKNKNKQMNWNIRSIYMDHFILFNDDGYHRYTNTPNKQTSK